MQEKAAECAEIMIGRSECTVRQWLRDFNENGEIPDYKQGKYQRTGVLWSSEELNEKVKTVCSRECSSEWSTKDDSSQLLPLG